MAERMNEQHRAAKAAQKDCTELYLLLLLHRERHLESALLVGIQVGPAWTVPALQGRSS
jgi:DIS3-like exonuclease 1